MKHRGLFSFSTLKSAARLLCIFIRVLFTFVSKRFRRCLKFVYWTTFAELVSEHAVNYLEHVGFLEVSEVYHCTQFIRMCGYVLYIATLSISFVASFLLNDVRSEAKDSFQVAPSTVSQMNTVLKEMQERFRKQSEILQKDRAQMIRDREQFQLHMASLHRQLQESFAFRPHQNRHYGPYNTLAYTTPDSSGLTQDQPFAHHFVSPFSDRLTPRHINENQSETARFLVNATTNEGATQRNTSLLGQDISADSFPQSTLASAFSPVLSSKKRKRDRQGREREDDDESSISIFYPPIVETQTNKRKRQGGDKDDNSEVSDGKKQKGNK